LGKKVGHIMKKVTQIYKTVKYETCWGYGFNRDHSKSHME